MEDEDQSVETAGKVLAAHRRGELRLTAAERRRFGLALAAERGRKGGGRPRTVEHVEGRYCRCAACRHGRGER